MMPHFVTVVVPVERGFEGQVLPRLQEMGNPAVPSIRAAIEALRIVHFMSISVIKGAEDEPEHVLMELSTDEPAKPALLKLADALKREFTLILAAAGIPRPRRTDLPAFLLRHACELGASWANALHRDGALGLTFCGSPGMALGRILDERSLADRIAGMRALLYGPRPAREKLRAVRAALWRAGDAKWAFEPQDARMLAPATPRTFRINLLILLAAFPALLWPLALLPLTVWWLSRELGWSHPAVAALLAVPLTLAIVAGAALWLLQRAEASDVSEDVAPAPEDVDRLMAGENHHALNLLVAVARLKTGWFRRVALRGALWVTSQALARSGRPGFLGDVGVVQYARWVLLPRTGSVVFLSNYDGSWESYMEDFVNLVPYGPTSIWSNCQGFPRTRWLFGAGATDGDRFRRWVRRQQIPTAFWYAAYPDLTLSRIRVNAQIRHGIAAARTDAEAAAWLALFGAPSP